MRTMQLAHFQSRLSRSNARFVLMITRHFASKGNATQGAWDEAELSKARDWLSKFNINSIPRSICAISFSRSSGPGGQNVNKYVTARLGSHKEWTCAKTVNRVNSKATLKVPLSALLPLVPPILHQDLRSCRYVADRTDALVIQSDEARKQSANVESCYEKLFRAVEESARNVIPGETSVEQRDRVRDLYVLIYVYKCKFSWLTTLKEKSRDGGKN